MFLAFCDPLRAVRKIQIVTVARALPLRDPCVTRADHSRYQKTWQPVEFVEHALKMLRAVYGRGRQVYFARDQYVSLAVLENFRAFLAVYDPQRPVRWVVTGAIM